MDSTPTLRTERLVLTPLQLDDAPSIQRLFPHWEVVRYLDSHVPWPYPDDGALQFVRDIALPAIARGEAWHWVIRLADESDQAIGCVSLHDQPDNHRGFWLSPPWQGQGYMSEACAAVNRFWFQTLGRPTMRVPKAADNLASRRISAREGMRLLRVQDGHFVSGPIRQETWELTRDTWLHQQRVVLEATLVGLEQALLNQQIRSDAAALQRLLADDFLEFGASGRVWRKMEVIDALLHETFTPRALHDCQVRLLADEVAQVTYTCVGQTPTLRSSIWRRSDDGWQMVFHQGTPTRAGRVTT